MMKTIAVEIDAQGRVHPLEPQLRLPPGRALLTLLDPAAGDAALLAESALAEDWLRPEEDEAWAHLQPVKS
ncbi:MAG: hypothetical protein Q7N95_05050 [Alphaproteobacteria bacterium]|nr:hypothetical protein [Alphaproteobacteria bacterium]